MKLPHWLATEHWLASRLILSVFLIFAFSSWEAGLFYPTAADRFFEVGRDQFERDIDMLLQEDSDQLPNLRIQPQIQEAINDLECQTWGSDGICDGEKSPEVDPTDFQGMP